MMKYVILLYQTSTGYSAYCPDVDGVVATGSSREECRKNMEEALEFHFEGMQDDRDAIPQPEALVDFVEPFKLTVALPSGTKNSVEVQAQSPDRA
jgi:predicted RNase H-like HicB family nuclease